VGRARCRGLPARPYRGRRQRRRRATRPGNPTTEDFIEIARIEGILGGGGINPAREIVVYSTRGHVGAYFAHFAIRYFGGQNVSVYHDGIDGWMDDKRPLETSETRLRQ
jgi:3-mercaptopyruvate sulfurtransferase SseA